MKKINILKTIVDLLWIFSMPVVLIIIGVSFTTFFVDLSDLNIELDTININQNDLFSKILFVISSLNYLLLIVALYFFRKVLTNFVRVRVFEEVVISSFKKIGNLLTFSGFISLIISIIGKIYFEQKVSLEFGLNQHLVLICLGLFFLVLSEIFKIAKNAKQENDLTI
ncbi:DUF2975 domain-containing protein [uncultured Polaribacter sp.]|jgi:hypothetical protein|uniref:DUF2975 domain-containing protein n=1 Tax=uncultured Polaribacter sp. TaxID=174711 RepID=UPI003703E19B